MPTSDGGKGRSSFLLFDARRDRGLVLPWDACRLLGRSHRAALWSTRRPPSSRSTCWRSARLPAPSQVCALPPSHQSSGSSATLPSTAAPRECRTRARASGTISAGTLAGRSGSPTSPGSTVWWEAWTPRPPSTRSTRRTSRPAACPFPSPAPWPRRSEITRVHDEAAVGVRAGPQRPPLPRLAPARRELVPATPVRLHR